MHHILDFQFPIAAAAGVIYDKTVVFILKMQQYLMKCIQDCEKVSTKDKCRLNRQIELKVFVHIYI